MHYPVAAVPRLAARFSRRLIDPGEELGHGWACLGISCHPPLHLQCHLRELACWPRRKRQMKPVVVSAIPSDRQVVLVDTARPPLPAAWLRASGRRAPASTLPPGVAPAPGRWQACHHSSPSPRGLMPATVQSGEDIDATVSALPARPRRPRPARQGPSALHGPVPREERVSVRPCLSVRFMSFGNGATIRVVSPSVQKEGMPVSTGTTRAMAPGFWLMKESATSPPDACPRRCRRSRRGRR